VMQSLAWISGGAGWYLEMHGNLVCSKNLRSDQWISELTLGSDISAITCTEDVGAVRDDEGYLRRAQVEGPKTDDNKIHRRFNVASNCGRKSTCFASSFA
jgi:hypothetical protein